MKRTEFIKSIITLIAAPKILGQLEIINTPPAPVANKIAYYFKVTEEMQEDIPLMEYMFSNGSSFLWKGCEANGIDLSKDFDFKLGYAEDDFPRNLLTGVITQEV